MIFLKFFWMNNFIEFSVLNWMNFLLNEYFGFCFELNFDLNHFQARLQKKSPTSIWVGIIWWVLDKDNHYSSAVIRSPYSIKTSVHRLWVSIKTQVSLLKADNSWAGCGAVSIIIIIIIIIIISSTINHYHVEVSISQHDQRFEQSKFRFSGFSFLRPDHCSYRGSLCRRFSGFKLKNGSKVQKTFFCLF